MKGSWVFLQSKRSPSKMLYSTPVIGHRSISFHRNAYCRFMPLTMLCQSIDYDIDVFPRSVYFRSPVCRNVQVIDVWFNSEGKQEHLVTCFQNYILDYHLSFEWIFNVYTYSVHAVEYCVKRNQFHLLVYHPSGYVALFLSTWHPQILKRRPQ